MSRYTYSKHAYDGYVSRSLDLEVETLARIQKLNELDIALYEHALTLFEARWQDMLSQTPGDQLKERFSKGGPQGSTYVLAEVDHPEKWVRSAPHYGKKKEVDDDDDADKKKKSDKRDGQEEEGEEEEKFDVPRSHGPEAQAEARFKSRLQEANRHRGVPKTIKEFANFHEVIISTDLPLCRMSRVVASSDFEVDVPPVDEADSERAIKGKILEKLQVRSKGTDSHIVGLTSAKSKADGCRRCVYRRR